MVECSRRSTDKVILPIFFDVDPQDVKLRTQLYIDALKKHEDRFGYDEVQRWKEALTEVASIKGWHCKDRGQGELIKLITDEFLRKLVKGAQIVPDYLVGIDNHVRTMMYLLGKDSHDVQCVVIHGMGGVGKTTLAKVVFNQIAHQFDGCSFLSNIQELSQQGKIVNLQNKLLSEILKSKSIKVHNTDSGIDMIRGRCRYKKVLIVLDNLDKNDQLVKLVENCDWFGPGSRIIVTTRDISFLKFNKTKVYHFYEMEEMHEIYAIQLFNRYAFERDAPPLEYDKITREIVKITGGLPLALVVIGSSLSDESEEVWDDVLAKLKKMPHKEVQDILKGKCRLKVLHLVSCRRLIKTPDFSKCLTLERLVVKDCDRLVEIDPSITMLQHLKHLEVEGCIGLRVLKGGSTPLDLDMVRQSWSNSLGNLKHLSTLRMENVEFLELPDSIGEIAGLQVLSLCDSSINKLPESIGKLKSLVKLNLSSTNILELPDSIRELKRLKELDMARCQLRKLPKTIGMLEKLEELDASYCKFLEGEIPMGIGALSSLKDLSLGGSRISEVPPSISRLSQLTNLALQHCFELHSLPELPTSLAHLDIMYSAVQRIPDLSNLTNLNLLYLSAPLNACQAQDLQCIGRLTRLSRLALDFSDMTALPADFTNIFTELEYLEFGTAFRSLVGIPPKIKGLTFVDLESTDRWSNLHTFKYLSRLEIRRSCLTEIPLDVLGNLENLRSLEVRHCRFLERLSHIPSLRRLRALAVIDCRQLIEIQGLKQSESLEELYIYYCPSLKELPDLFSLQNLSTLNLLRCASLESLPIVNKEKCRLNVFGCKMLPHDSSPEFERFAKRFTFIIHIVKGYPAF
ncbi:hypothetical protein BT93_I0536 [Corymbia citriodora subsp. variegata]|nr:hypothetical protein BT93_I0536 [Corymbia citriodora subsp. variegata]